MKGKEDVATNTVNLFTHAGVLGLPLRAEVMVGVRWQNLTQPLHKEKEM